MGGVVQQVGDGVLDESMVKEVAQEVSERSREDGLAPVANQNDGQKVLWERFLPVRTIKVLLVENDDSTRQVVTALLRNCSYEVTAATNGLQAWKILEDLTNHIDLVLADVVMPCLSGIGLLCKIMSHKTCKTIPVILMSSKDSMGIVFKCLSEGAVDFLVKPIRKNELKNLWQHVWRRCHSSSGSGSGSDTGTQTQKSPKSKSVDNSYNHSGSNDGDYNRSFGLNAQDGSDSGSGTQSSWTKRAVGVDSPQPMPPSDQLPNPHDSTCAQVIYPKPETFFYGLMPMTTTRNVQEQKEFADNTFMGKDLEIVVPGRPYLHPDSHPGEKVDMNKPDFNMEKLNENEPEKEVNVNILELDNNENSGEPCTRAADLIGGIAKITDFQMGTQSSKDPDSFPNMSETVSKTIIGSNEWPSLELSLKRLQSSEDDGTAIRDGCNILRHSDQSAFSRYNTSALSAQAPAGDRGSYLLPLDNSLKAPKTDSTQKMLCNSNGALLKQSSNENTDQNDMGSTTVNAFTKSAAPKEKLTSSSMVKFINPSSANQNLATQQVVQEKFNGVGTAAMGAQSRGIHIQVHFQHHHHHYNHHHHHVLSMQQEQQQEQQKQPPVDQDDLSLKNMETDDMRCGSSQLFIIAEEGNVPHLSLNGSISGSNHGSNGQNGSSTAAKDGGVNMDSDNGIAGKSGIYGASGSGGGGSGEGVDQNHFTHREAAMNKFRQKRKERNFEKKVRYQSRKRLAEQRPRLRGQFVRQIVYEHTRREAKS
ncbi:putative response regulator and transcription factor RR-A-type family [Dioscorea sansibarensis]